MKTAGPRYRLASLTPRLVAVALLVLMPFAAQAGSGALRVITRGAA
jgi:hypothetical protein